MRKEKNMKTDIKTLETNYHFDDFVLDNPITDGLILQRWGNPGDLGHVRTNIPHFVNFHLPTTSRFGFEFGNSENGTTDLALNVIEILLHRRRYREDRVHLFPGTCFLKTTELFQKFKQDFLVKAPKGGCVIPYAMLEKWLDKQLENDR